MFFFSIVQQFLAIIPILRRFATKNLYHEPPCPTASYLRGTKADPSPPAQDDSQEKVDL